MTLKVKLENGENDEKFKKYFMKNLLNKQGNTFELSFVPENAYTDLQYFVQKQAEINGWVGCVIVNKSYLDQEVPNTFEFYQNKEGKAKKWREYTKYKEKENDCAILIGYRDSNGNRGEEVTSKEFYDYVNYFGIDKIKHRDDYLEYFGLNK